MQMTRRQLRYPMSLCIIALCGINAVGAQSVAQPSDTATIRRLDSLWAHMYARHDTVLARSLYAEDLVFTSANGNQKNREAELTDVRPQPGLVMDATR
jgi:hypothetical protein